MDKDIFLLVRKYLKVNHPRMQLVKLHDHDVDDLGHDGFIFRGRIEIKEYDRCEMRFLYFIYDGERDEYRTRMNMSFHEFYVMMNAVGQTYKETEVDIW